jgi:hypothetical protein
MFDQGVHMAAARDVVAEDGKRFVKKEAKGNIPLVSKKMNCSKCLKKLGDSFVSKQIFNKRMDHFCDDACLKSFMSGGR